MIEIKNEELIKKVTAAIESVNGFDQYECEYEFLGIRFEDKVRTVGEICQENSKDNDDREDEREFPEYGTKEYDEMPELDGLSTYDIDFWQLHSVSTTSDTSYFDNEHLYLIGSERKNEGPDNDEFLLIDGEVLAVII